MSDYHGPERREVHSEQKLLLKEAFKEAAKEWLDDQFALFGKWSLAAVGSVALAALGYFILWAGGFHK